MRALAGAVLLLLSCSRFEKQESAPAPATSVAPAVDASAAPLPVSTWSKDSREALELAASPDRSALVVYVDGGYVLRRGESSTRLPREWFGVGPPRRDISISSDARALAVPVNGPPADQAGAVIVYDATARRFRGRLALPKKEAPDGGEVTGKVSADGKSIVWTLPGRPCLATDIETSKLAACK